MTTLRVCVPAFPYDRWRDLDAMSAAVTRADELGFWSVSLPEHIIMPIKPGAERSNTVWYDAFVLGSLLAARTERIRIVLNALVVPYRNVIEEAKLIATLDVVSKGRLVVTAGTGWMRREFNALGVPFEDRGARTTDMLRAMKVLWTESQPSYDGEFVSFAPVWFEPKCIQHPHVPIWIGGDGPRPFRRAIELGDGWIPMVATLQDMPDAISRMKTELSQAGRDPEEFTFSFGVTYGAPDPQVQATSTHSTRGRARHVTDVQSAQQTIDTLATARQAGVNHFTLHFNWQTETDYIETIERFAADVMSAF